MTILKLYKKKQKAEYLKYREWAGKKDKGGCVADFHQGPIYLCDPWEPLSVCEMPQSQRTCAAVWCACSASYVCETETRSGGQGKDTPLGKLEGGWTLTEGPFPLGRHGVLVQPCCPCNSGSGEHTSVCSAGDRLWSQWPWGHSHWLKSGSWKLSAQLACQGNSRNSIIEFVVWGMWEWSWSLNRWTGVVRMHN